MKIIIPVSTHHGNNNRHVIFCRHTWFSRRHTFGTIAINCRDDWLWITGKIAPRLWGGWKLPTWRITGRVCAGRRGNSRSPQPETPTHGRQTTPHTAPSRLTNSHHGHLSHFDCRQNLLFVLRGCDFHQAPHATAVLPPVYACIHINLIKIVSLLGISVCSFCQNVRINGWDTATNQP